MQETTTIRVNSYQWKEFKKHCIDKDTNVSEMLDRLIKKEMKGK